MHIVMRRKRCPINGVMWKRGGGAESSSGKKGTRNRCRIFLSNYESLIWSRLRDVRRQ